MAKFIWTDQLNVGINVIDQQHRRIVEYINQLEDARSNGMSNEEIFWLFNHIKRHDNDYVDSVKAYLAQKQDCVARKRGLFARFFG